MAFKPLPRSAGDWEQAVLRSALIAGFMLLTVQLAARFALSGWARQHMEEMLWPFPLLLSSFLVCGSVVALLQRQRLLGLMAAVVAVLSALIALLPILLQEAIRN